MGVERNANIELFRVFLTFGIVLLHTINLGGYRKVWLVDILMSCVVAFVFISGWFGVTFTWKKLAKLLLVGAWCAVCMGMVSGEGILVGMKWLKENWFFSSYIVMMIFAVFVNGFVNGLPELDKRTVRNYLPLLPFLIMVFVWGFGRTLPFLKDVFPKTDGLNSNGGITLLGIYCVARVVRVSGIVNLIRKWHVLLAVPILMVATGVGLNDYNSPFAFLLAFMAFWVFARIRIPRMIGDAAVVLGPSMYSVFLIHTNSFGFKCMEALNKYFLETVNLNIYIVYLVTGLIVFSAALTLDLPRRFLSHAWRAKFEKRFS